MTKTSIHLAFVCLLKGGTSTGKKRKKIHGNFRRLLRMTFGRSQSYASSSSRFDGLSSWFSREQVAFTS